MAIRPRECRSTIFSASSMLIPRSSPPQTFSVCSVWKPLRGPLQDWPLAVCDAASVDADNLVVSDKVYSDFATENIQVHRDARQRWYYLSGQQPDELLVFRQTDSKRKEMGGGGEFFFFLFHTNFEIVIHLLSVVHQDAHIPRSATRSPATTSCHGRVSRRVRLCITATATMGHCRIRMPILKCMHQTFSKKRTTYDLDHLCRIRIQTPHSTHLLQAFLWPQMPQSGVQSQSQREHTLNKARPPPTEFNWNKDRPISPPSIIPFSLPKVSL